MADEADIAQENMELEEARRRMYTPPVVIPKGDGFCLECGAELDHDGRWCDAFCRDTFQMRQR